jgi:hypothetical protein
MGLLFNMNQFVVPVVLAVAIAAAFVRRRRSLDPPAAGLLAACGLIVIATVPWSATVSPAHFHRYVVHATPLACLCVAWGILEAGAWVSRATGRPRLRPFASAVLAVFVALSPVASNVVSWAVPTDQAGPSPLGTWLRPEIGIGLQAYLGRRPDPNREAIELVRARARPDDEILVAYEDIPFMFYTDNLIRGGIPAFRVQDRSAPPPRFLVARPGVPWGLWPAFVEEVQRYRWERLPTKAPAVFNGNNPDPGAQSFWSLTDLPKIIVAERVGDAP